MSTHIHMGAQHHTQETHTKCADPPAAGTVAAAAATDSREVTQAFAEVLAAVLQTPDIPPGADFFADLGADSMLMARFCARVRKQPDLPTVSMQDVYTSPTLAKLVASVSRTGEDKTPEPPSPIDASVPTSAEVTVAARAEHLLCGLLQLVSYLAYSLALSAAGAAAYLWVSIGNGLVEIYLRAVGAGALLFVASGLVPIAAKWLIIGRWKPGEIRIWSLAYYRFWLVKTLIHASPMVWFLVGSPALSWYLRALGAQVGRNVLILTRNIPVCTDLVTLGTETVLRKDCSLTGYRAHAGRIQIGSVTLGAHALVGEMTVIDINTGMGERAQLGHRSTLHSGQVVPPGESWHGSPARPCDVDYRDVETLPVRSWRQVFFVLGQLFPRIFMIFPLGIAMVLFLLAIPRLGALLQTMPVAFTSRDFYIDALLISAAIMVVTVGLYLPVAIVVPRLLSRFIACDRTYPLFGVRYSLHRTIVRLTNSPFLLMLFGDSSFVVGYLRALGYSLDPVEQTGSNFGTEVKHEAPSLVRVGTGTMVADGLSVANAHYSGSSFRVSRATIGGRSFLGNHILYPAGGRTGENCLLATKVMVPLDGPVRENVGLLGSPSFEIPRSVERDASFDHLKSEHELPPLLAAKNRYNLATIVIVLLARWLQLFIGTVVAMFALEFSDSLGVLILGGGLLVGLAVELVLAVVLERAAMGFRAMSPQFCSIYDPYFWQHERFWKLHVNPRLMSLLNGTPFKPLMWRLLGVRIGRQVFDDGCNISERSLVSIGSFSTLNAGAIIQCHSQEDGTFKADRDELGDGVTLGVGALVHYGVTVGDGAVIATDAFVMKGEVISPSSLWGGNPAREIRSAGDPYPVDTPSILPSRTPAAAA